MAYKANSRDQFIAVDSGRLVVEDGHSFCFSCNQDMLRSISMKETDGKYVIRLIFVDDDIIEIGKMSRYEDGARLVKRISSAIDCRLGIYVVIDGCVSVSGCFTEFTG